MLKLLSLCKPDLGGYFMYFRKICKNNLTYSIDMLRMSTEMSVGEFSKFELKFNLRYKDFIKKQWHAFGIADFKNNYNIELSESCSFWFGFLHNSEIPKIDSGKKYNFTIEFNPNKLKDSEVILYILSFSREWSIKQFDIAIDIPVSILDICGLDKKHYKDIRIFNAGFDNKTIYIGRTNNRIKIYNKKKESKLTIAGDLTRCEVTCKINHLYKRDFLKPIINLPNLYTNHFYFAFREVGDDDFIATIPDKDKTLYALLYAVQQGYNLNDLSRKYKTRISELLKGDDLIKFDLDSIYYILNDVIYFYLVR